MSGAEASWLYTYLKLKQKLVSDKNISLVISVISAGRKGRRYNLFRVLVLEDKDAPLICEYV